MSLDPINIKEETLSTIKFNGQTASKMDRIALKLGRSKRLLFSQMVDYFYRSKKDPLDVNDELLKNMLVKNHQKYIGFIKAQEEMLLIPAKMEMSRISESQRQIIDRFNKEVLKHNVDVLNNQNTLAKAFGESGKILNTILDSLNSKQALKAQFTFILDNYIRSRDSFGMMTSAREKEDLIALTKELIRLL